MKSKMKMGVNSKVLLRFYLIVPFVFCVFGFLGQGTGRLLADGALVPEFVSYSAGDATSATRSIATTKMIKMACYPARARCVKDADCCSGHCQGGFRGTWASATFCTK
jgi:hypothetical protein